MPSPTLLEKEDHVRVHVLVILKVSNLISCHKIEISLPQILSEIHVLDLKPDFTASLCGNPLNATKNLSKLCQLLDINSML